MSALVSCPLSMRDRSWSIEISVTACCAGTSCAIAGNGVASRIKAATRRMAVPFMVRLHRPTPPLRQAGCAGYGMAMTAPLETQAIIIGAGMSGLLAAIRVKQAGVDFAVL